MSSIGIEYLREKYSGKTDPEIAEQMAEQDGYVVIVRYKNSSAARDYSNFGTCHMEEEVNGYLNSPYCYDVEIIYDARKSVLRITPEMIMAASCGSCNKATTSESLVLMGGNDFYFCPKCAKMFCDRCYVRLPLTDPSGGYGMCPDCMVEVQRAYSGAYGKKPFGSEKKESDEMKACGSCGLSYEPFRNCCPFCGKKEEAERPEQKLSVLTKEEAMKALREAIIDGAYDPENECAIAKEIAKRGADVLPELLEMVLQYDPDKDIDVQGDNWGLSRLGLAFIGNHWQLNEAQAQKIFDRFIKGRSYDEADKNYWEQIWKASRHILMNQGFKFEE